MTMISFNQSEQNLKSNLLIRSPRSSAMAFM